MVMVPVTARPYAAARLDDDRKTRVRAQQATRRSELISGT